MNRKKDNLAHNIINYIKNNKSIWLVSYWAIYLVWFVLIEKYIVSDYFVSYLPIDDMIPFVPGFVTMYVLWYPFIVFPIIWLYFKDIDAYKRYMWYIIIGYTVCMLVCTFFPNGQDLRPDISGNENIFCSVIAGLYRIDTNTNVLPSLHVVGCIGTVVAAFDSHTLRNVRIPALILGILISVSTVFIKQHSVLDMIAGIVVGLAVWLAVYVIYTKTVKGRKIICAK